MVRSPAAALGDMARFVVMRYTLNAGPALR